MPSGVRGAEHTPGVPGATALLSPCLRAFTTLCYSADGESILAGGMSKFVCIYHVKEQILRKKFEISCNLSLDAMEVRARRAARPPLPSTHPGPAVGRRLPLLSDPGAWVPLLP